MKSLLVAVLCLFGSVGARADINAGMAGVNGVYQLGDSPFIGAGVVDPLVIFDNYWVHHSGSCSEDFDGQIAEEAVVWTGGRQTMSYESSVELYSPVQKVLTQAKCECGPSDCTWYPTETSQSFLRELEGYEDEPFLQFRWDVMTVEDLGWETIVLKDEEGTVIYTKTAEPLDSRSIPEELY